MSSWGEGVIALYEAIGITINPFLAKTVLRFNPFRKILVMCKGYSEDYDNYTELVWKDDYNLGFNDRETYPEFQLWIIQDDKYKSI